MAMGTPQAQLHPHNPEVQNHTNSCLIAPAALVALCTGRPLFCESDKQKRAVQILSQQSLCTYLSLH
jgi:hypothetical protein